MRGKLRNVRIEKGYKDVEKLAKNVGISASYYYKIEQGKRTPGIYLAKKIADILDHTVDELFFNQNLDETSKIEQII
ncbi:helix-turn-helix transcriptional regulator [Virgibacillus salexigens]|uniref:helix-turn-helix transcriptional regulator n=1 Tax=Virgibacillus salexigens TaxID=61016 RepID=UPI0030816A11